MNRLICLVVTVVLTGFSFVGISFFAENILAKEGEGTDELPIFAIDAQAGLPFMLKKIRGKSLFLLGDGSHGTEEFYAFRKQFTRHLIKDFGLRIVVLEAEWDAAKLVDDYINNRLSAAVGPRQMLAQAFERWPQWVWANEELVEFVLWLKDFNRGLPEAERIRCYGMDMQLAVDASLAFLSKQWPPDTIAAQKQLALTSWWRDYVAEPIRYKEGIIAGTEKPNLIATELLALVDNQAVELKRVLLMLVAVEEYYRIMAVDKYKAWNVRARYMAAYVSGLVKSDSSGKGLVVWAHNSHVGDMRGADVTGTGLINLGQLMRQAIGSENVFILGTSSYEGTVLAAEAWDAMVQEFSVTPAREGSVEFLLNSAKWDNPLLFFENEEQRKKWDIPFLHRGIGVIYDPENEMPDNYLTTNLSRRYDALVFWKKTRSLRKLVNP